MIHLTLVPFLAAAGELKTKPTQHSVKMLLEQGVQPDIIVCRAERSINEQLRSKIALFCNVSPEAVIESIDAPSIYDVPILMLHEGLDLQVLRRLNMPVERAADLSGWEEFLYKLKHPKCEVTIGLVGKYVELKDSYKSIIESFVHADTTNQCKINLRMIHSEEITHENVAQKLKGLNGVLVILRLWQ